MTTNELLELTMLHALGMLEDDECEAYEAAFAAAPAPIRENIRAEARRMADLGALIPESEPRPELREMVLAAVRAAMHEQVNEQRIAEQGGVAGRIHAGAGRSYTQPKLSRSPRVHRVWRATSIGLAAAVVALTVVTVNLRSTYHNAGSDALIAQFYDGVGGEFFNDTMFSANTKRVVLTSNNASSMGAAVFANPDWKSARLMIKNLRQQPNDEPFRLVVLDSEGNILREVTTFTSTGEIESIDIKVNLSTENNLAIYQGMTQEIQQAQPLLTSVNEM